MNDVVIFPRSEQETTISFSRYDDMIEVYTSDSTVITKLNKVVATENIDVITTDENGRIVFEQENIPTSSFSIEIPGKVRVRINADAHKGSYSMSW